MSYCSGVSSLRHSSSLWVTGNRFSSMLLLLTSFSPQRRRPGSSGIAVDQLDRDPLRRAQEGNTHAGANRGGLPAELGALGLELGDDRIDAAHQEPEMIEALIGRNRRRIDAVARRHRRDEYIGAAKLEVNARLAALHGADHLGAEHAFVVAGGRLRIRAAQMDVIVSELGHHGLPSVAVYKSPSQSPLLRQYGIFTPAPPQ